MEKPLFELKRLGYKLSVFKGYIEENSLGLKSIYPIGNISDIFSTPPFGTIVLTMNNGKKKNFYLKGKANEFLSVIGNLMHKSS